MSTAKPLHVLIAGFGEHPTLSFSVFFYAKATLEGALVPVRIEAATSQTLRGTAEVVAVA